MEISLREIDNIFNGIEITYISNVRSKNIFRTGGLHIHISDTVQRHMTGSFKILKIDINSLPKEQQIKIYELYLRYKSENNIS
jgi:hypothetical protein